MSSVYQHPLYLEALIQAGESVVSVTPHFAAVEKILTFPFIGSRKILQAQGTPTRADLDALKVLSKKYFYATVAPCVLDISEENFFQAGYKKVSNGTILIELRKKEEDLWKLLEKKSIRWGVNTAQKNQLRFSDEISPKEFNELYDLYLKTAQMGKFTPEKKDFLLALKKTNLAKYAIVQHKSKIVAGGLILIDKENNYAILDFTTVTEEGSKLQAMPFLYWNFIKEAKNQGLNYFDLGGFDLEAGGSGKMYQINKFKERFGGENRVQPIFATNYKYGFLRALAKKLTFLKRMYSKK